MTQPTTKICILGGGFGGLYTALRLSQLPRESTPKPEIILVDQSDLQQNFVIFFTQIS
jgi:NADH dehydrogenase